MVEASSIYEKSVNSYQSTRRYNPEDSHLRTYGGENLEPNLITSSFRRQLCSDMHPKANFCFTKFEQSFWLQILVKLSSTNCKKQKPSSETNSQEVPRPLWSLHVNYRIHNSPPRDAIISARTPALTPHFFKNQFTLFFHLRLGLPSSPFPSVITVNVRAFRCYMCRSYMAILGH
jgi:hypothetical protein